MWLWWLAGPQCTRPETDCVFRSGQNVVVAVLVGSVQEWSECDCGCACWQRVQEWS